ncbi:MAG: hypothetical protein EBT45_08535, partial [Alphaproteobacteria bacterium]|nr:hypothetical protein [Alphaproteobacteria bacterium]
MNVTDFITSHNTSIGLEGLESTIHEQFEEQARNNPNNIALKCDQVELSYEQLNQRANQLANFIKSKQEIVPDTLIALFLDRSEFMIEGILGVLKTGAGYVPLDPSYPAERIRYILEDTKASVILTTKHKKAVLNDLVKEFNCKTKVYCLDAGEAFKEIKQQSKENPQVSIQGHNLAYVIYTSGTTGQPKGVMIEHRSLAHTVKSIKQLY